MATIAKDVEDFNRQPRRDRRDPDQKSVLGAINNDGYEVVGSMVTQMGHLEDICDANSLEDQARAQLGAILREQERVLRASRPNIGIALDLNRRAQSKLALVDVLDAEQGLDRHEPVRKAKGENRRAHAAGKRIIAATEPKTQGLRVVDSDLVA